MRLGAVSHCFGLVYGNGQPRKAGILVEVSKILQNFYKEFIDFFGKVVYNNP